MPIVSERIKVEIDTPWMSTKIGELCYITLSVRIFHVKVCTFEFIVFQGAGIPIFDENNALYLYAGGSVSPLGRNSFINLGRQIGSRCFKIM